jgi:hypothetical protein
MATTDPLFPAITPEVARAYIALGREQTNAISRQIAARRAQAQAVALKSTPTPPYGDHVEHPARKNKMSALCGRPWLWWIDWDDDDDDPNPWEPVTWS